MSGLSAEDREALAAACGWPGENHDDLTTVVEAITGRAVAAALTEAADAIEESRKPPVLDEHGMVQHGRFSHSGGLQCDLCPGYPHAYCIQPHRAAAIVRDRIPQAPATPPPLRE